MRNFCLILLCCWVGISQADVFDYPLAGNAQRQAAFQQLADKVHQQGRVEGRFVQAKHLQMLARPIVSEGNFSLTPMLFSWSIEKPFAIHYEFSEQRLVRVMDGQRQTLEPAEEPVLYGFFSFFFSLFKLSEPSLDKFFTVYYQTTDSGWELGLTPKKDSLARSLKQLIIQGSDAQIKRVQLMEESGDITELDFSYPSSGARATP